MTHRVFPHIPAGAPVRDADSSHVASGSFSPPTDEPPGRMTKTMHNSNNMKFGCSFIVVVAVAVVITFMVV